MSLCVAGNSSARLVWGQEIVWQNARYWNCITILQRTTMVSPQWNWHRPWLKKDRPGLVTHWHISTHNLTMLISYQLQAVSCIHTLKRRTEILRKGAHSCHPRRDLKTALIEQSVERFLVLGSTTYLRHKTNKVDWWWLKIPDLGRIRVKFPVLETTRCDIIIHVMLYNPLYLDWHSYLPITNNE